MLIQCMHRMDKLFQLINNINKIKFLKIQKNINFKTKSSREWQVNKTSKMGLIRSCKQMGTNFSMKIKKRWI